MKLLNFVLLSAFLVLLGLASASAQLGRFFDTLSDPFNGVQDSLRRLFSPLPLAQLPEQERLNKNECRCRLSTSRRIVGGVVAPENIPWTASLIYPSNHSLFCGATIVNNWYVITTAHCTDKKTADQINVRVGVMNIKENSADKTFRVAQIFNGQYKGISVPGDIAILKLARPLQFQRGVIEPGCLNLVRRSNYKNGLMASGFGTTTQSYHTKDGKFVSGQTSDVLKQGYFYQDFNGCKPYLICINSEDGSSSCNGDSGGPLHYFDQGITTVEGAASFVRARGRRGQTVYTCNGFSAYSRFSYYDDFIKSVVGNEFCTK